MFFLIHFYVFFFSLTGLLLLLLEFIQKNRKMFVKPTSKKKQADVDHITGDKIPKSFVFARGKLPGPLRQLQMNLRKLMLPFTALKLKVNVFFLLCFLKLLFFILWASIVCIEIYVLNWYLSPVSIWDFFLIWVFNPHVVLL